MLICCYELSKGTKNIRVDLSEATLSGADLSKANFSNANLSDASLLLANLSEANLKEAKNLSLDQLSEVKTLCNAKLNEELLIPLNEKYPALFEKPKDEP